MGGPERQRPSDEQELLAALPLASSVLDEALASFVIDGAKYDLPGIAKDGELLVSPADANMELRVQEVTEALGADAAEWAATGGEDYELCACVPPAARTRAEAAGLRWIGTVEAGEPGVEWLNAPPGADAWRGFEH